MDNKEILRNRFYDLTDRVHYIGNSNPELIIKLLTELAIMINYSNNEDFITEVNYFEVTDSINSWIKQMESYKNIPIN